VVPDDADIALLVNASRVHAQKAHKRAGTDSGRAIFHLIDFAFVENDSITAIRPHLLMQPDYILMKAPDGPELSVQGGCDGI
jgi:hypothetical protein